MGGGHTLDESAEVVKDYGPAVGRIIKIDLSSNGLDAFGGWWSDTTARD